MTDKWISMSDAGRWMQCTGAAKVTTGEIREAPGAEEENAAAEGTKAHRCAAALIKRAQGRDYDAEAIDSAVPEMLQAALDYVSEIKQIPGRIYVEAGVTYNHCRGCADAIVIGEDGHLTIIDFKYGAHTPEHAAYNAQLILYALGAAAKLKKTDPAEVITMMIVQPRMSHKADKWETRLGVLESWYGLYVKPAEDAIIAGGAPKYAPEMQRCRNCRNYPLCIGLVRAELKAGLVLSGEGVTQEDRELLWDTGPVIIKALQDFLNRSADDALKNGCPEGYEIQRRTIRTIPQENKEEAAEALLSAGADPDDIFTQPALKPLTQLQGILTDAQMRRLQPYIEDIQQQPHLRRVNT